MADAYDVMSMAKQRGAQLKATEDYENWFADISDYADRYSQASQYSDLFNMITMLANPMEKLEDVTGLFKSGEKGAGWQRAFPGGETGLTDDPLKALLSNGEPIAASQWEQKLSAGLGGALKTGFLSTIFEGLMKGLFKVGKKPKFKATGGTDPWYRKALEPFKKDVEETGRDISRQKTARTRDKLLTHALYGFGGGSSILDMFRKK